MPGAFRVWAPAMSRAADDPFAAAQPSRWEWLFVPHLTLCLCGISRTQCLLCFAVDPASRRTLIDHDVEFASTTRPSKSYLWAAARKGPF